MAIFLSCTSLTLSSHGIVKARITCFYVAFESRIMSGCKDVVTLSCGNMSCFLRYIPVPPIQPLLQTQVQVYPLFHRCWCVSVLLQHYQQQSCSSNTCEASWNSLPSSGVSVSSFPRLQMGTPYTRSRIGNTPC